MLQLSAEAQDFYVLGRARNHTNSFVPGHLGHLRGCPTCRLDVELEIVSNAEIEAALAVDVLTNLDSILTT